jgi:hypothetical protein
MPPKASKLPQPEEDVTPDKVGDTVQSFIDDDGVKQMDVSQQNDGNFTITPEK